jgi:hypothetical protein
VYDKWPEPRDALSFLSAAMNACKNIQYVTTSFDDFARMLPENMLNAVNPNDLDTLRIQMNVLADGRSTQPILGQQSQRYVICYTSVFAARLKRALAPTANVFRNNFTEIEVEGLHDRELSPEQRLRDGLACVKIMKIQIMPESVYVD